MIGEAILFLIALLYIIPLNNSLYSLLSSKITSDLLIDFLFLTIIFIAVLLIGLVGKYLLIRLDIDYKEYKVDKYMIGTSKIKGATATIIIALILVSYYLGVINLNKIDIKVITLGLLIIWFLIIAKSLPLEEVEEDKKLIIKEGDKINPLLKQINKKKDENINNINLVEEVSSIGLNKEEFIEDKVKDVQEKNQGYKRESITENLDGDENIEDIESNEIQGSNNEFETYEFSEEEIIANNKEEKEAEKLRNYKEELISSRLRLREKQQRRLQEKRRNK